MIVIRDVQIKKVYLNRKPGKVIRKDGDTVHYRPKEVRFVYRNLNKKVVLRTTDWETRIKYLNGKGKELTILKKKIQLLEDKIERKKHKRKKKKKKKFPGRKRLTEDEEERKRKKKKKRKKLEVTSDTEDEEATKRRKKKRVRVDSETLSVTPNEIIGTSDSDTSSDSESDSDFDAEYDADSNEPGLLIFRVLGMCEEHKSEMLAQFHCID